MGVIVARYIVRSYLKCFCVVALGFLAITSMLEYMELVRKFSSKHVVIPHGILLKLTIFHSISTVSSFFPFATFVGCVIFFSVMHSKLELTAMKILGISSWKIIRNLLFGVSLVGALYLTVFDVISVYSANKINMVEAKLKNYDLPENVSITSRGVWFKDVIKGGSYIVHASAFVPNSNALSDVRFFKFDENNFFVASIHSKVAYFQGGHWILENAKIIDAANNKQIINKFSVDNLKTKSGQEILLEELVTTDYHEIVGFEKFAEILDKCLELKRPFVVINPDIFAIEKVNDKKRPILCQGGIGEFYERAGGEVLYFGKPYQTIFDFAKNFIKNCSKTAMIGDTPWTDILGGNMANLDTILVLKGVSASFLGEITDQNISEKIDKLITEISLKMTHKSFLNQSMRPTHIAKNFAENL